MSDADAAILAAARVWARMQRAAWPVTTAETPAPPGATPHVSRVELRSAEAALLAAVEAAR